MSTECIFDRNGVQRPKVNLDRYLFIETLDELCADIKEYTQYKNEPAYDTCGICEEPFTEANPCWHARLVIGDGRFMSGVCRLCAGKGYRP